MRSAPALSAQKTANDIIPVLGKGGIALMIDPSRYTLRMLSDLAVKFYNKGYKMDFDDHKDDVRNALLKISLRKSDSKPNTGASETFRVNELKKTGYVIFVGANGSQNLLFVHA